MGGVTLSRLSLFLPSFAADYSGVCSCLFDLDFLVVMNDAACCTRNYVDYDEPRWSREKATTLCSQLRALDVIMGDEAGTIAKIVDAAHSTSPRGIAVLGSPVPAITGMDTSGMAKEVEALTGIPSIGFATTGFATYEQGIDRACHGLLKKFCAPPENRPRTHRPGEPCEGGGHEQPTLPAPKPRVNVLGITPLDFGTVGTDRDLESWLQNEGFEVGACWCMGFSAEDVRQTPSADVNLVVSAGALKAATTAEALFGMPFVVGLPIAGKQAAHVAASLRQAAASGSSAYALVGSADTERALEGMRADANGGCRTLAGASSSKANESMLIAGDWVCASSLRSALRLEGWPGNITVASLFGKRPAFAESKDAAIACERQLVDLVRNGNFSTIIGDPLLERIPGTRASRHVRLAHPALSSNLFETEVPRYLTTGISKLL